MVQVSTQTQPKVWLNGHYVAANKGSDGKWYAIDDSGKRIEVEPNDLFGINSNLTEHPQKLVNYYEELLGESEEKKASLSAMGKTIKSRIEDVKTQYNNLLAQFGVKKYSEITDGSSQTEAKKYYSDLSDLRRAKTSNSNRYYSACMRSFGYALEKGKWQNELNLAEHVESSLGYNA